MCTTRHAYVKGIKKAKHEHWSSFLFSLSPFSVWTARKLAMGSLLPRFPSFPDQDTPQGINQALLSNFFPAPPPRTMVDVTLTPISDYFPLSEGEVTKSLSRSSSDAAPGPDSITFGVLKKVHRSCPALLSPLLRYGHHPASLKNTYGVVL